MAIMSCCELVDLDFGRRVMGGRTIVIGTDRENMVVLVLNTLVGSALHSRVVETELYGFLLREVEGFLPPPQVGPEKSHDSRCPTIRWVLMKVSDIQSLSDVNRDLGV